MLAHPTRVRPRVLLALAAALLLPAAAWAQTRPHDRWYVVEMQGQRSGWMHDERSVEEERVTTTTEMHLSVKRGAMAMDITIRSVFVETVAGEPVSVVTETKMGAMPVVERYEFRDDGLYHIRVSGPGVPSGGLPAEKSPPVEGTWLTPAAAAEFVEKRLGAGAEEITVRSIEPLGTPRPVVSTRRIVEHTTAEALGKTVPAIKWKVTLDAYPGIESTEFVDPLGVAIRSETNFGGITMTMILADRDLALSELDAPELLVATLVKPSRPIEKPRRLKTAAYLVERSDGGPLDVPPTGHQSVAAISDSAARVIVDVTIAPQAAGDEADSPAYRESSSAIDWESPAVAELYDEASKSLPADRAARAEKLRAFVHDHIETKDLGVGFASASETAITRTGDCSEHGTLLAALLRADGIPSRVVSGLVYVDEFVGEDGVFGYHMWTQALLDADGVPRWVDLDATLPAGMPFDATHIAFTLSSLSEDDATNDLIKLAPLLGNIRITVEDTK